VVAPSHSGNTIFDGAACGTIQAQAASFVERPQDMIFLLNQMLAANVEPASPFFGAIDPDRVGMSGHSFGGLTTALVEQFEPRVKVVIPMAAATIGATSFAIPSLSLLGQIDSRVSNDAIRATHAASTAPKYLVEIQKAGHYAFSNLCFPGPDCAPPATLTQDEAHAAVLRWVLPFLELHLNGNQDFAPFFLVPPPGVVFAAEAE
jgi:predicted dienelactone hydrolase